MTMGIHPDATIAPGFLANHAALAFNRVVDSRLRQHGLTQALAGPLLVLAWKGPLTQSELVRESAVRQPAMAALLDRLQTAGMVDRNPSEADRRATVVRLTETGSVAARTAKQVLREVNALALEDLTPTECAAVTAVLARMVSNLER